MAGKYILKDLDNNFDLWDNLLQGSQQCNIYLSSLFLNSINRKVKFYLVFKANEPIAIKLLRNRELISITVTPMLNTENIKSIGVIGVMIKQNIDNKEKYIYYFKFSNLEIIYNSFYDVFEGIKMVFKSFINIIAGNIDWRLLSGPISIAELSSETLSMGVITYLSFLVFLNINVGFLNLLPIPTLDGGQLFFYIIEAVLGRPLKHQNMIICQRLGVFLLFLLFMLAVYNDVFNLMIN